MSGVTAEKKKQVEEMLRNAVGPLVADAVAEAMNRVHPSSDSDGGAEGEKGGDAGNANAAAQAANLFPHAGQQRHERPEERGLVVGQMIGCYVHAKGDTERASKMAGERYGEDSRAYKAFQKSLSASDDAQGGFLVDDEIAAEVIELLRPASVVRDLGAKVVPMVTGTLRFPKLTGGATGQYIGEAANAPKEQQATGQIVLSAKKLAVLTPVSNDLVKRASSSVDAMVRDDLVRALASRSDLAFIRGDGTGGQPKGLLFQVAAANKISANATVNLANTTTDLGKLIEKIAGGNVPMTQMGWMFSPRTWRFLITIRDGNGNLAFRDEMAAGTLYGFPFRFTSNIPDTLGGGSDESEVYLADFDEVIIGEAPGFGIDVSDTAAYFDGSAVQAAFSRDETVIRAIQEHDLAVRHDAAVAVLDTVTWT